MSHNALQNLIAKKIEDKHREVDSWFEKKFLEFPSPVYCSIDLRDSGFKIAPVDSNLYPAGFNNICDFDQSTAPEFFKLEIQKRGAAAGIVEVKKVLIIPESHTSNLYYIENLLVLKELITHAGFEVQIGWASTDADVPKEIALTSVSGKKDVAHPIEIVDHKIRVGEFVADVIFLNNDFSGKYPACFDEITQPIIPSHKMGWHTRKKSNHFKHYNLFAKEFAELIGIDPWLITVETHSIDTVDFNEDLGVKAIRDDVAQILEKLTREYAERKIDHKPFVFVKDNSGTYGMGIMVVHSADELDQLNRRKKNKMSVGKSGKQIDSVAIQEGIPTALQLKSELGVAEPVIYLVGDHLIGGFLRANTERGTEDNLNSKGMVFRKLCMTDLRELGDTKLPVLELVYGTIAKLSALSAGKEMSEVSQK